MKSRRRALTLLEVLVVILILSLISGVFTLGIQQMVQQQRFNNEVNMIVDRLRLAQDLMLLYDADIRFVFSVSQNDHIHYQLKTEQNLSENWNWLISKKAPRLKAITEVSFNDESLPSRSDKPIELMFYSKGTVMSKGRLLFSNGTEERYVYLDGYPKAIQSRRTATELHDQVTNTASLEEALTRDTMQVIQQAQKVNED